MVEEFLGALLVLLLVRVTSGGSLCKFSFINCLLCVFGNNAVVLCSIVGWVFENKRIQQHSFPGILEEVSEKIITWWGYVDFDIIKLPSLFRIECRMIDADPLANVHIEKWYGCLSHEEIEQFERNYAEAKIRDTWLVKACLVFVFFVLGGIAVGLLMLLFLFGLSRINGSNVQVIQPTDEGLPENGIYVLERKVLWFTDGMGIGIVWQGVLHTKAHVVKNVKDLYCNGSHYERVFLDEARDLATWGGLPRIKNPGDGERCVVKVYTPDGAKFMVNSYYNNLGESGILRSCKTLPGSSGSPIFVVREDGEPFLAGLVGNSLIGDKTSDGLWSVSQSQIEILPKISIDFAEYDVVRALDEGGNRQIFQSPGSGKTAKHAPNLVQQGLRMQKIVYFSAPTRAICKNAVTIFRALGIKVADWSRDGTTDVGARVIVAPHSVLFMRIVRGGITFSQPSIFILDETHVESSVSISLVHHLRHVCGQAANRKSKHQLVEMTATGYNLSTMEYEVLPVDRGNVKSRTYDNTWVGFSGLLETLANSRQGEKIVVFCGRVKGPKGGVSIERVEAFLLNLGERVKVYNFHRGTFAALRGEINEDHDPSVTVFILTTNMSEIGVNLNVSVVVDPMMQMTFTSTNDYPGLFTRNMSVVTLASQIQRQGRTGRGNLGEYWSPEGLEPKENLYHNNSVEISEANVMCRALGLPGMEQPAEMSFCGSPDASLPQIKKFLEESRVGRHQIKSLLGAVLSFKRDGTARTLEERGNVLRTWSNDVKAGRVNWRGHVMKLKYFDERDADLFWDVWCTTFGRRAEAQTMVVDQHPRQVNLRCVHDNRSPIVDETHENWECKDTHSHLCHCGHVYSHKHLIDEESQHKLECPCH